MKLQEYIQRNPDEFKVSEHGTILSPGKFQAEPLYVPWFYMQGMEGFADEVGEENGTTWEAFKIDEHERAAIGEHDKPVDWLVLFYRDDGFIDCELTTDARFQEWQGEQTCGEDDDQ